MSDFAVSLHCPTARPTNASVLGYHAGDYVDGEVVITTYSNIHAHCLCIRFVGKAKVFCFNFFELYLKMFDF
jgi:hypothetical protein